VKELGVRIGGNVKERRIPKEPFLEEHFKGRREGFALSEPGTVGDEGLIEFPKAASADFLF